MRYFRVLLLICACGPVSGCALLSRANNQTVEVCLPDSATTEVSEEARKQAAHAERLMDHGKLLQAEREFLGAIQLAPHFGEAHNNLGLIYFQRRQLYDAAHSFQRAIELLPGIPEPHNNLGMVMEEADRPHDAILHYENAYSLNPLNPLFLGNLVRARIARGDCTDDVAMLLQELILIETRPEWVAWARDELYLMLPKVRREVELAAGAANDQPAIKPDVAPEIPPLPAPVGNILLNAVSPVARIIEEPASINVPPWIVPADMEPVGRTRLLQP